MNDFVQKTHKFCTKSHNKMKIVQESPDSCTKPSRGRRNTLGGEGYSVGKTKVRKKYISLPPEKTNLQNIDYESIRFSRSGLSVYRYG